MSKILITGAAGFIGSQLAHRLFQEGHILTLIDNFSYGKEDNLIFDDCDFRKDVIRMDIRDREGIAGLFESTGFDFVYHIAAITPLPDCQMNPQEAVDVNVTGTVNILEAGRIYGVKKILFASTSAVYENDNAFPSMEESNVPPSLLYPTTKFAAEHFCRIYHEVYNMNITVFRFANVYGPHIDCLRTQPPVAGYLIRELLFNRRPQLHSNGDQRRDFVYVDDLVDLGVKTMQGTGYECINVSTGETHSINEMYEIIAGIMNKESLKPTYTESINYWKQYPDLYKGAFPISEQVLEHEVTKYTQCSNVRAREYYGWTPKVDFKTGLKHTVDFSVKAILQNS